MRFDQYKSKFIIFKLSVYSNHCENTNTNLAISINIFTKVKIPPIGSQIKIIITHRY